ncbi:zinc metallopeptidase [Mangrovivirga sp. M17]|uniref:Zinc metallopeptidase n=1 Tax=Mangrovivirga halotolerans TaxID=2993936 RepID=A0ABT3RUC4_9BACT|nr:zinc metallopeptidase [Mangrovivirga halotolerans]MCX2744847.1 zinc metallopeptidase [Mangrovivirga halotolerans]
MIWIIFIVFGIISFAVSQKLKSKFKKYSKIGLQNGLTGAEVARLMLADNNIHDVKVTCVQGELTDHYNPAHKTVNLSEAVYHGNSAASAAVASHECGHAVQHANAYSMLKVRSALVPIQNVSAKILNIVVIASIFGGAFLFNSFPFQSILLIIIGAYSVMTLFSLVTLPVEFDASKRALAWVKNRNIVTTSEYGMAKDALKWAAMTYVVAAIASLVTLMYYISLFLGSRD